MDKNALKKFTYGLFLLSARHGEKDNACIINTAIQVASDPLRIAVVVLKSNLTHDLIRSSGALTISSISTAAPFELFKHFGMQSGRDVNKFADFAGAVRGESGRYELAEHANMVMDAKVLQEIDLDSHTMFIAEVTAAKVLSEEPSCSYDYYQSHIKPKKQEGKKKGWVCNVCGYVYEGDPLPADFICPWCKHGAEDFEKR